MGCTYGMPGCGIHAYGMHACEMHVYEIFKDKSSAYFPGVHLLWAYIPYRSAYYCVRWHAVMCYDASERFPHSIAEVGCELKMAAECGCPESSRPCKVTIFLVERYPRARREYPMRAGGRKWD
jgi:hypothetical protein